MVGELLKNSDHPQVRHPDSWKYYRSIKTEEEPFDIFHELAVFYKQEGNHYHQLLEKGENTLTLKFALLSLQTVIDQRSRESFEYDLGAFLNRYFEFLLTPGKHKDTFVGNEFLSLIVDSYLSHLTKK